MLKKVIAAAAALLALTGCSVQVDVSQCSYTEDRSATVPVASVRRLVVDADAGFLVVEGRPGLTEVRVTGVACASSESALPGITLTAEGRGDQVEVRTQVPSDSGNSRLDLTLEVPEGLAVQIRDDSGTIRVHNVEIRLEEIRGNVTDRDDSGNISVRDVRGDFTVLTDGSGKIEHSNIGGRIDVPYKK